MAEKNKSENRSESPAPAEKAAGGPEESKAAEPKQSKKLAKKPEKVAWKPFKEKKAKLEKAAAPKARSAPRLAGGGAQISFICSECYEEFFLSASQMKETVTCPECLHVGKKPQEDFLKTVHLHKGGERKSLFLAGGLALILGLVTAALIYIRSPYSGLDAEAQGQYGMILGGTAVLLVLAGIWLAVRYERNRWEVYF
ncbi:MAG: hypothetical protein HY717_07145 [Planctomycetes bacterium]|nr:hypothetical protein [Planctomycetota bacterium]